MKSKSERMNARTELRIYAVGILFIVESYLAWCFSTITYQSNLYMIVYLLLSMLGMAIYSMMAKWILQQPERGRQFISVACLLLILSFMMIIHYAIAVVCGADVIINVCYLLIAGAWVLLFGMVCVKHKGRMISILANVRKGIQEANGLLIVALALIVLAILPTMNSFAWDGQLYKEYFSESNLWSMSSLGAYGHLSHAYGALFCVIRAVVRDVNLSFYILNIGLYLASVIGFYLLIQLVAAKSNRRGMRLLSTIVYAVSPFLLGMVNYYSLDFMTLCMFVWILYFSLREKWLLFFVASVLFVFTKEPAVIVYACFCLGLVIRDLLSKIDKRPLLQRIFCTRQYYLMLLVGMLWGLTYRLLGGWSGGESSVGFSYAYAIEKLKVLYVLNFNWIFVLIIVIGGLILFVKRRIPTWWIPVVCSGIGFTVFSILLQTVNHARYAAPMPVILLILALYVVMQMPWEKICIGVMLGIAVVSLAQCFCTVDPLSILVFQRAEGTGGMLITTGDLEPGDATIYNKQMLQYVDLEAGGMN